MSLTITSLLNATVINQAHNQNTDISLTTDGLTELFNSGVLKANLLSDDGINIQIDEIRAKDVDGLSLFDDGGNGIFVEDGGNVGIGTNIPGARLDIVATGDGTSVLLLNTERGWAFQQEDTGSATALRLRNVTGPNKTFYIDTNGSTRWRSVDGLNTFMMIDQGSGNVGIGTTTPIDKLEVQGRVRADRFIMDRGGIQDPFIELGVAGVNKGMSFFTVDVHRMIIAEGGNVGIGTTGPNNKLHIQASGASSYFGANRGIVVTDNLGPRVVFEDTSRGLNEKIFAQKWESGIFSFNTLNDFGNAFILQNILAMDSATGNVGINESSPLTKLHVDGAISVGVATFSSDTSTTALGEAEIYICTSVSVDRTLTISSVDIAKKGRKFVIKDTSGSLIVNSTKIRIVVEGGEFIDDDFEVFITEDYGVVRLFSDGLNLFSY